MTIFNSYFDITRGYIPLKSPFCWLNPVKPPWNHHFPMISYLVLIWSRSVQFETMMPLSRHNAKETGELSTSTTRSMGRPNCRKSSTPQEIVKKTSRKCVVIYYTMIWRWWRFNIGKGDVQPADWEQNYIRRRERRPGKMCRKVAVVVSSLEESATAFHTMLTSSLRLLYIVGVM